MKIFFNFHRRFVVGHRKWNVQQTYATAFENRHTDTTYLFSCYATKNWYVASNYLSIKRKITVGHTKLSQHYLIGAIKLKHNNIYQFLVSCQIIFEMLTNIVSIIFFLIEMVDILCSIWNDNMLLQLRLLNTFLNLLKIGSCFYWNEFPVVNISALLLPMLS